MFCLFQVKQEVFSVNSYKLRYLQQSWSYCDKISVSVRLLAVVYQTHIWTVSNINSNNVGASLMVMSRVRTVSRPRVGATISSHQPNQPALSPDSQRRPSSSQHCTDSTVQQITEIIFQGEFKWGTGNIPFLVSIQLGIWVTGKCILIQFL